jgi:diguanylate cyclase (GGDEF)-like protein/PAS domain S-box-containing protein
VAGVSATGDRLDRAFLQAVYDSLLEGVLVADAQTRQLLHVNQAACRMFGYSAATMLTMKGDDLHPADWHERMRERFGAMAAGLESSLNDMACLHCDGSVFYADIVAARFVYQGKPALIGFFRDVTARVRAAAELRASEARLSMAQRMARIGSWELDLVDNRLQWSDEIFRIFEIDPTRFTASYEGFLAVVHADDRDAVNQAYTASVRDKAPYQITHRLKMADGRIKHVQEHGVTDYDAVGRPVRSVGTVQDITDRVEAENALRQAEERLELALKASRLGLYDLNVQTGVAVVNDEYARMLGYEPAEFAETNQKWIERLHPDDLPRVSAFYQAYVRGEVAEYQVEFRQRTKSGKWKWILSIGRIMERDANGEPLRMVGTHLDIDERKEGEQRLRQEHDFSQALIDCLPTVFFLFDAEGRFLRWNKRLEKVSGFGAAEIFRMKPLDIIHPDDRAQVAERIELALATGEADMEARLLLRNGQSLPYYFNGFRLEAEGRPCILGTGTDLSSQKQIQEALSLSAQVFESSGEAIMITDPIGVILSVNRAFTEMTGWAAEEAVGQSPRILKSDRHDAEFYAAMWHEITTYGHWQGEIWDRRKNGEIYPKWASISAVRAQGGEISHYVAIFSDITRRKAAEEKIEFLAHHDPLTRLPNRILLRDRFEQGLLHAARAGSKVAVIYLDLDRFKAINDTLGHPVGDRLLVSVAERLRTCVRESDTISRQGGDEFVVVLMDVGDAQVAGQVAGKIIESLATPFDLDGHVLATSGSIGISLYPDDGDDFDNRLKQADTALYHAKDGGRNTYRFFDEAMNRGAVERLQIEQDMRLALDRHEFSLHYQPYVDLDSGQIVGAEALLRWAHPRLGMIPPAHFIPIAEESGLIVPIGTWVLNEACRQNKTWQEAGFPPITVAVNLSAIQFRRDNLAETVSQALAASGLESRYLELELTESILIHDGERALDVVRQLKAKGLRLSIDDFGTGYSSLSYLKRFAVDKLKIDQSFVRELASDEDATAIVRAVIQLGRSLKLTVIAEGVETENQFAFLRQEVCHQAQGYYISRPVPASEFERLLQPRA